MRYIGRNDPQTPDDLLTLLKLAQLKHDHDSGVPSGQRCYEDYILELFGTKDAFDEWCLSNNVKCSPVFELSIRPTSEDALQASVLSKQRSVAFAEKQLQKSRDDLRAATERLKERIEFAPLRRFEPGPLPNWEQVPRQEPQEPYDPAPAKKRRI